MSETLIYKPPGSVTLDSQDVNFQLRIGLQGEGATGKTHAGTTFDNPIFVSYDRGLVSHIGNPKITEVPFYNGKFVDTIVKRSGILLLPNRKDALVKWLSTEGLKLTKNQILILDASTGIELAYHQWWEENKESFPTASGSIDAFKEWRFKLNYFGEIMTLLKEAQCNIIYICHESPDRDSKGNLNGQVRPLLTGQFQDSLLSNFTDWYRCRVFPKPKKDVESITKFKEFFNVNDIGMKELLDSTPPEHEAIYMWQTQSDSVAKCKTSLSSPPKFILANASSFNKYKRKQTTT